MIEGNFYLNYTIIVFVFLFPSFNTLLAEICDAVPDRYERKIVLELIGNLDK